MGGGPLWSQMGDMVCLDTDDMTLIIATRENVLFYGAFLAVLDTWPVLGLELLRSKISLVHFQYANVY